MDQALVAEVKAWIEDDPDPVTASRLQKLLDSGDETTLRTFSAVFSSLERQVYVAQTVLALPV